MRQFKMFNFLVLTVMLIVTTATAFGQGSFAGGSGTAEDPYLVATAAQLDSVRNYLTAHFKQTAEIDLNIAPYNEGEGWMPISIFRGQYNGNGHVISRLYINRPSTGNVGLFGRTYLAKITNLGVIDVEISGDNSTGALVGYLGDLDSVVSCYSSGTVAGSGYRTGGLIGRSSSPYSTSLINSFSTANVTGASNSTGGLVGEWSTDNGRIINCYSTGSVSSESYQTGGLVGYLYGGTIRNCYSTGNVTGGNDTGGLVGKRMSGTAVYNSFWNTETSGQTSSMGGTGKTTTEMKTQSTFTDAGWDFKGMGGEDIWNIGNERNNGYPYLNWQYPDDPGPVVTSVPVVTTAAVTDITETTAVSGGDVTDDGGADVTVRGVVWSTSENPTLESNDGFTEDGTGVGSYTSEITGLESNTDYFVRAYATNEIGTGYGENISFTTEEAAEFAGGSGTESDPFQITTPEHLDNVRNYLGSAHADKHFKLMNDIDLGTYLAEGNPGYNDGKFWIPLGGYGSSSGFYGNFDGNGLTISNLAISSDKTYVGFFGYLYEGSVAKDLTIQIDEESEIINTSTSSSSYTGGLAGYSKGTVTGCSVYGDLWSETPYSGWESIYAGGLIGYLKSPGSVSDCRTDGYIEANGVVGGLVGSSSEADISESSSGMDVVGDKGYTGGLIGEKWHGNVTFCYATGDVTAEGDYVGGFIGDHEYGSITNCFATGDVEGAAMVGGFAGTIYGVTQTSSTRIENCFATGEVTGTDEVGGFVGRNTSANILNSYARGDAYGDNEVGGFIGYNSEGIITHCYSTGEPEGESDIGGFAGRTASWGGTYTGCFWDSEYSQTQSSAGGTGKTTAEMKTQATFTDAGWDFSDIWAVNSAKNDGYPYLQWQDDIPTAIEAPELCGSNPGVPDAYVLNNAYPNPFNPTTTISYGLPEQGRVKMVIYNIYGQKIAELVNQTQNAGWYQTAWNGKNQSGVQVSSGVYLCHISIIGQKESFSKNIKMLLTK